MDFERIVKLAGGMAAAQREFPTAYDAGRDCALHGANLRNCHFGFFGSAASLAEWERGKASANNPEGQQE